MSSTLILGAGIFGLSTAYHLALQDPDNASSITILDRCPAPSTPAASTDLNKIVRADYSNPLYMNLGFEAIDAWTQFPFFKRENVFRRTGWVAMDEEGSDLAERIRGNFRACGRDDGIVDLSKDEVRSEWGGLLERSDLREFVRFYFNPTAGWADAVAAVRIMAEEVVKMGVKYQVGEARRILLASDGVKGVQTEDGEVTADRLLLSTGAWTSALMSPLEDELEMAEEERVENQVTAAGVCVAHIQLSESEKEVYGQLPVLVYGGHGEVIPPTDNGIFKFTNATSFKNIIVTPTGHSISVPPAGCQLSVPQKLQDEATDQVRARFPQVLENRQVDYFRLCWDSISRNQQPLITQHPDARLHNLYLAVGGSFHCWKFLPIIGRYVVNALNGMSNGPEKNQSWAWKSANSQEERGVHEKVVPRRDLKDYA